jgi:dTDP-4-amino-4,6-dideoxygalactose transaminase
MSPSTAAATAARSVPFAPPDLGPAEIAEVVATLESGWLSTGPRVRAFEEAFAAYTGAPFAIALNSCTAALHLSLLATGVGPGDEVITTPLTFCATANVIVHTGATPVFADVEPATMNLDPAAAAAAITPRARAIIPVHFAGRPVDVAAFEQLARTRHLTVIEDAAHCVEGVAADGRKVGATADFTCFSFYATKNLTTGEGGMVTTHDARAAERIRMTSLHGMDRAAWNRYAPGGSPHYDVMTAGFKYNMMDLQAAIGLHQLAGIDARLARRAAICARYDEGLAGLPLRRPAPAAAGTVHARHLYPVLVDPATDVTRDELHARLRDRGISTSIHFRALHLHPFYQERFGLSRGMFPAAEAISDATLSLPLSPALSADDVDRVIEAMHDCLR